MIQQYRIWALRLSIIFMLWVALTYILFYYQRLYHLADTAFVAQILENFKRSPRMDTVMGISIIDSMDSIWDHPSTFVCQLPLTPRYDHLPLFHYYFISYLYFPLVRIFSVPLLLALSQAGIYLSVAIFAFAMARKMKINGFLTVQFSIVVMQHPLWSEGIFGQFYFNRLFLPLSALVIWILENRPRQYFWIMVVSALAASTNEIYGIGVFLIILSYLWIYKQNDKKLIIIALAALTYSIVAIRLINASINLALPQVDFIEKATTTPGTIILNFFNSLTSRGSNLFLAVNMLYLGILTFFSPRAAITLFIFFFPNLFINIGGAEKTGWSTHYHILYFVPLIWLSLHGLKKIANTTSQYIILTLLLIISAIVNPYTLNLRERAFFVPKDLLNKLRNYPGSLSGELRLREKLLEAVPEDDSVSLIEPVSYMLYTRKTYYYPQMIDSVDKVVLRYYPDKLGVQQFGSISYGRQFDSGLDLCIRDRMKRAGFDIEHPKIIGNWVVFKKL